MAFSTFSNVISSINFPDGLIDLNLDIYDPENMEVSVPYNIENPGFFDLTGLYSQVEINVNFFDKTKDKNITNKIFSKSDRFPSCRAFRSQVGNFKGNFSNFNITAILDFQANIDIVKPFDFLINIYFRGSYFFNLIKFSVLLVNLDLTGV